jgi:hypothetical protein
MRVLPVPSGERACDKRRGAQLQESTFDITDADIPKLLTTRINNRFFEELGKKPPKFLSLNFHSVLTMCE